MKKIMFNDKYFLTKEVFKRRKTQIKCNQKNEKSNFNNARCSLNAFFLCREENVQKV